MNALSGYLDGLPSVIAFVPPVNRNPENVNFDLTRHIGSSSYQTKHGYRVSLERSLLQVENSIAR